MLTVCPKAEPFSLETKIKERINTEYFERDVPYLNRSPSPLGPENVEPLDFSTSTRRNSQGGQSSPFRKEQTPESGVSSYGYSPDRVSPMEHKFQPLFPWFGHDVNSKVARKSPPSSSPRAEHSKHYSSSNNGENSNIARIPGSSSERAEHSKDYSSDNHGENHNKARRSPSPSASREEHLEHYSWYNYGLNPKKARKSPNIFSPRQEQSKPLADANYGENSLKAIGSPNLSPPREEQPQTFSRLNDGENSERGRSSPDFRKSMEDLDIRKNRPEPLERTSLPASLPYHFGSFFPQSYLLGNYNYNQTALASLLMSERAKSPLHYSPTQIAGAALLAQMRMQGLPPPSVPIPLTVQNPLTVLPQEIINATCTKNLQEKFHIAPSEIPIVIPFYQVINNFSEIDSYSETTFDNFRQEIYRRKKDDNPSKSRRGSVRSAPYSCDYKSDPRKYDEDLGVEMETGDNEVDPQKLSYYEKRRKNNEAAKKSRDQRKCKEEETVIRGSFLEQENVHFKVYHTRCAMPVMRF